MICKSSLSNKINTLPSDVVYSEGSCVYKVCMEVALICNICKKEFKRQKDKIRSKLVFCSHGCLSEAARLKLFDKSPKFVVAKEKEYDKRHKHCCWCNVDYCDVLKRNSSKACSKKCMYASMSKTRHDKGSYCETLYTSAHGGFRQDLGTYFRSNWEANYARIMNYEKIHWEYEPKTFRLLEGMSYTPDFLIDGKFFELKGRMLEKALLKINMFKKMYPEYMLTVIGPVEYFELRSKYKKNIELWEGK